MGLSGFSKVIFCRESRPGKLSCKIGCFSSYSFNSSPSVVPGQSFTLVKAGKRKLPGQVRGGGARREMSLLSER